MQRLMPDEGCLFVVVFGPVGVGKSSVVEAMSAHLPGAIVVPEPTEPMIASGALGDVYANQPGSAFRLQMLVLHERLSSYWQAMARLTRARVPGQAQLVLGDGHAALDSHLFLPEHVRARRMDQTERLAYLHVLGTSQGTMTPAPFRTPGLYLYLRAEGRICAQRAAQRNRTEETELDVPWFERMVQACDRAVSGYLAGPRTCVVTLDARKPLAAVVAEALAAVCAAQQI